MRKTAELSADRVHRFTLTREWDKNLPPFVVIGLNPSTADENADDPTIRRCIGFAKREGCGSLIMLNLFSYRATDPKDLKGKDHWELSNDSQNHYKVKEACNKAMARSGRVVCAWGVHGILFDQGNYFRILLGELKLECLGHTKQGHPRHPLYVKGDEPLIQWEPYKYEVPA